jgi:hypothetical protein
VRLTRREDHGGAEEVAVFPDRLAGVEADARVQWLLAWLCHMVHTPMMPSTSTVAAIVGERVAVLASGNMRTAAGKAAPCDGGDAIRCDDAARRTF